MKHLLAGLTVTLVFVFTAGGQVVVSNDSAVAVPKKGTSKPVSILEQTKTELDKVVQLSDDQKKAIDNIIASAEKSRQELDEAIKPIKEAYDKSIKDKDSASTNKAIEELRSLYKRQTDINAKAIRDILGTLSAEKLDLWYDYKLAELLKPLTGISLNKEQIEKAKQEFIKLSKDTSSEPLILRDKLWQYIYKEVLSADQKTDQIMVSLPKSYHYLKLSKEQIEKIKQECKKLNNDSSLDFNAVLMKLYQYMLSDVLTEAQKAAEKAELTKEE